MADISVKVESLDHVYIPVVQGEPPDKSVNEEMNETETHSELSADLFDDGQTWPTKREPVTQCGMIDYPVSDTAIKQEPIEDIYGTSECNETSLTVASCYMTLQLQQDSSNEPISPRSEVQTEDIDQAHTSDNSWQVHKVESLRVPDNTRPKHSDVFLRKSPLNIYRDGNPVGHIVDTSYHGDIQHFKWDSNVSQNSPSTCLIEQPAVSTLTNSPLCKAASTKEKRFRCSVCAFSFNRQSDLKRHMRTHTGERPFKCSVCDSDFKQSGTLATHMLTHTGEKPFKCSECSFSFRSRTTLKLHMITHTGVKPFQCSKCELRYLTRGHLTTHMMSHTGERPFKCSVCEYMCKTRGPLTRHMRTHTGERPFDCSLCEYSFKVQDHLTTHMRTHTGEKPYSCSLCDYRCARQGTLNTHMRTHTGEKPYRCSLCDFRCARQGNLNRHVLTHTRVSQDGSLL